MILYLILKVPHAIFVCKLLKGSPDLGQDTTLKATHVEQEVWVVFTIDGDKRPLPLNCGDGTRETVFDIPEDSSAEVNIMFHQPHACITRPAFFVVVANYVLIVGIRVLGEVALDQITSLFC